MSQSPQTHEDPSRDVCLTLIPGTGDAENNNSCNQVTDGLAACWRDDHHRKLAICSIICGLSCIGISALINSVKAEEARDQAAAVRFKQLARKRSIISIVTWLVILVSVPILLVLISYLLTLIA